MKNIINQPDIYAEIGTETLLVVRENKRVELPLERAADGRLTAAGKEKVTAALQHFLQPKSWQTRARAICAINARGVSLRKLSLPAGAKEEFHNRLLLQIESEFPLPPAELAWGYQSLGQSVSGTLVRQELLVAAVKKEIIADYQAIFSAAGANPVFTLASWARNHLCAQPAGSQALLDVGDRQSELTGFEKGAPVSARIISWTAGVNLDALVSAVKNNSAPAKFFISGRNISDDFALRLARALGAGWQCERLENAPDKNSSAAIAGLQKITGSGGEPALTLRANQTHAATHSTAAETKKWLMRAAALIVALLLLPYAEAILLKAHLAKKVAQYQADAGRLTTIDRELDFLRYLKQNQPPYINALFVFAQSVSPGTKFDSITMNGQGDVSLRATFNGGQQVTDFRSKLIASGTFTNVIVEEQAPGRNGPQVTVRLTAHWKTGAPWPAAKSTDAGKDGEVPKTGAPAATSLRKEMN